MIKRIFILCTLLLATAYLILAVTTFNSKPADQVCKGMELTVKDSIDYGFVTDKEVKEILKKGKIYPEGKQLSSINVRQLEELRFQPSLYRKCRVLSYIRRQGGY